MAYEFIIIYSNTLVSRKALVTISTRCLWLKHLHLPACTEIRGDMVPLGLLANLRTLNCKKCTGLTGACQLPGCAQCQDRHLPMDQSSKVLIRIHITHSSPLNITLLRGDIAALRNMKLE